MQRELLNPPGVQTPQASYSHVGRVGNVLYIAGQVAVDQSGALVGKGDAEAQAEQIFKNIEACVKHFGGGLENVLRTTTYVTNWGFRALVSSARERLLKPPYPANTLVVISALASPDYLVEIEAIAALDA